jgi:hypothetical protein
VGCILSPLRGYGPPLWLPDFLHVFGATLAASSRSAYLLVTGSFLSPLAGLFVFLWFHTHGLRPFDFAQGWQWGAFFRRFAATLRSADVRWVALLPALGARARFLQTSSRDRFF